MEFWGVKSIVLNCLTEWFRRKITNNIKREEKEIRGLNINYPQLLDVPYSLLSALQG